MLALCAERVSESSWLMAFDAIESSGCCSSLTAVIFEPDTVICTCMGPYWVFSLSPVKVCGAAEVGVAGAEDGVVAGAVGLRVAGVVGGVVFGAAVLVATRAGAVDAGTIGVGAMVAAFADFAADGLVVGGLSEDGVVPGDGLAGALAAGVPVAVGVLMAAASTAEWDLNENNAASPATVPPRVSTARRNVASWE
jgi:hypothetical protein